MKYDSVKIALAIRKAVQAAAVFENDDDGGTCNFDCAYICVPGMREAQAKEIEALAGVRLSLSTYRWHGRILQIVGGRSGQGMRQTKMAEAMKNSLVADGFDASVYYQMD